MGIYLRDGPFSTDIGIVILHPYKGTHWNCYTKEKYFDSYGVVCPKKQSEFIIKRNGDNKFKKMTVFVQVFVFNKIYLTKVLISGFKSAILNSHYQRFS